MDVPRWSTWCAWLAAIGSLGAAVAWTRQPDPVVLTAILIALVLSVATLLSPAAPRGLFVVSALLLGFAAWTVLAPGEGINLAPSIFPTVAAIVAAAGALTLHARRTASSNGTV